MEKKLTFELTVDQTNAIFAGLNELPARIANPVLNELDRQAKLQIKPISEVSQPELLLEKGIQ